MMNGKWNLRPLDYLIMLFIIVVIFAGIVHIVKWIMNLFNL